MSEQEKKLQRIWFAQCWNQAKVSLSTKQRKKFFYRKRLSWGLNKKYKKGFLTALTMAIKKDPTMSIWKHANELKVHKKTEENN